MHQLSKSHLCKNAKKKGLARSKKYALIVTKIWKQKSVNCLSKRLTFQSVRHWAQACSQDLEKGGGLFERVRKVQTTLTRIFIVLKSVSRGLSENWDGISRKALKFKRFFRSKTGGLRKKKKVFAEIESDFSAKIGNSNDFSAQKQVVSKKKKKKRKVFAEIESDFSAKIAYSNTFSHRITTSTSRLRHPLSFGGAVFNFSPKIGLKSNKNVRFCILHKLEPPPPWLRYWLSPQRFGFKISLPELNSLSTAALDGRLVLYWVKSFFNPSLSKEFASMDFGGTADRKVKVNTVKKIWIKGYGWSDMRQCVLCCQCNTFILNGIHKKSVICFKHCSTKSNCNFFRALNW